MPRHRTPGIAEMTAEPLPTTREIRLATAPEHLPGPEHLSVVETLLPVPGPGQVVVRNRHFLVFPGLRTLLGGGAEGARLLAEADCAPLDGTLPYPAAYL